MVSINDLERLFLPPYELATTEWVDGDYSINISARDLFDNSASASFIFTISKEKQEDEMEGRLFFYTVIFVLLIVVCSVIFSYLMPRRTFFEDETEDESYDHEADDEEEIEEDEENGT